MERMMVDATKLRAWYAHRQGLDGSLEGKSAADILIHAGWARSVGGVSPYLALFSRAGITREQADGAAKKLKRKVLVDSGMKTLGALTDLPSHAIVDRGRLVGLWEYDPSTQSIAWMSFVKKDKALREAVTHTENFVRDQLGDARSFSLDSPKSRAPRIAALRKFAASA